VFAFIHFSQKGISMNHLKQDEKRQFLDGLDSMLMDYLPTDAT